jgi:hypothetical protein
MAFARLLLIKAPNLISFLGSKAGPLFGENLRKFTGDYKVVLAV